MGTGLDARGPARSRAASTTATSRLLNIELGTRQRHAHGRVDARRPHVDHDRRAATTSCASRRSPATPRSTPATATTRVTRLERRGARRPDHRPADARHGRRHRHGHGRRLARHERQRRHAHRLDADRARHADACPRSRRIFVRAASGTLRPSRAGDAHEARSTSTLDSRAACTSRAEAALRHAGT